MNKKPWAVVSAALMFGSLVAGCGSGGGSSSGGNGSGSSGTANQAASSGNGAATTVDHVKIMCGGLSKIIYLPAELTERLGYFKKEGLDVELDDEAAGQNAEEAMLAGQVDAVVGFYDHTIDLQAKGKTVESVVQFGAVPGEYLMVTNRAKDKIKTLSDLAGQKIGITGLGSSTNFLATYLVTKGGHKAQDYTPVPVGAGNTLIAAMQQNRIDLAITTEPTVSLLESKNVASVLVDMSNVQGSQDSLGGAYPASSLYLKSSFVEEHPEVVQKMADAFVQTMQYIHTHTPEQIADELPADYYAGDKAMYVKALTNSLAMFTPDGKMPADGPQTVYNVLSTFDPKLKDAKIDLDKTYTTQFVDKAIQSGK
jgi:NitT/TauT family transport system substrate-binding protein